MIVISAEHNAARLAGSLAFLDAGAEAATVYLYDGERAAFDAAPAVGCRLIAIVTLARPAGSLVAGSLVLTPTADALVLVTGTPTWARAFNGDGKHALDGDVSDSAGTGDFKVSVVPMYAGGVTRITSAVFG